MFKTNVYALFWLCRRLCPVLALPSGDASQAEGRHRSATYHIVFENPRHVEGGVAGVWVDGAEIPGGVVALADDGHRHEIRVVFGA